SATQTVQVVSPSAPWALNAAALASDPDSGDDELQLGSVSTAVGIDLDQSPGTGVGLGAQLVYHSDSVSVRPVVQASLQAPAGALPAWVRATLTWDGVAGAQQSFATAGLAPGQLWTLALQPPSAVTTSGRHSWSLSVTADYGNPNLNVVKTASGVAYV